MKHATYVLCFGPLYALALVSLGATDAIAAPANFKACASIEDGVLRLACYDAAAGRTATGPAAPPQAPSLASDTPSAAAAASTPESRFGDTGQLPSEAQARRQMPTQIEAYVKRVSSRPNGRYLLTLDNNEVWQTTEANWALEFRPEDAVTIYRMPLGGYQISLSGKHRSLGVKRIN